MTQPSTLDVTNPVGGGPRGEGLFFPIVEPWLIAFAGEDTTAHAVANRLGGRHQAEQRTACGLAVRMLLGIRVCMDGTPRGLSAIAWPPRLRTWRERHGADRCRDCWTATGRPRPSGHYDDVRDGACGEAGPS